MESNLAVNPLASKGVLQFVDSYKPEKSLEVTMSSKNQTTVGLYMSQNFFHYLFLHAQSVGPMVFLMN
jgi:hypothetical protein